MIIIAMILTGIAAFFFGFLIGCISDTPIESEIKNSNSKNRELERLKKEYENFLSYDGSEQV